MARAADGRRPLDPELIRIAGGDPILSHDGVPTRAEEWDALTDADPDVVLLAPCGYPTEKTERELPAVMEHLAPLRAVREGRAWILDGNAYFNRPGPRLVESAELAAAAIHPQTCKAPADIVDGGLRALMR